MRPRVVKELPLKACKVLGFSHGGHLFAAANGSTISIYNALTFELLGNLRPQSSAYSSSKGSPMAKSESPLCS